jgi:hypothetical protein
MNITFSGHARKRMRERNVSQEDIEHVLSGRGSPHPSARKRTWRGRSLGGARLEVVYTEASAGQFHIVTVKTLDR